MLDVQITGHQAGNIFISLQDLHRSTGHQHGDDLRVDDRPWGGCLPERTYLGSAKSPHGTRRAAIFFERSAAYLRSEMGLCVARGCR
jgi:hypothetical protein